MPRIPQRSGEGLPTTRETLARNDHIYAERSYLAQMKSATHAVRNSYALADRKGGVEVRRTPGAPPRRSLRISVTDLSITVQEAGLQACAK